MVICAAMPRRGGANYTLRRYYQLYLELEEPWQRRSWLSAPPRPGDEAAYQEFSRKLHDGDSDANHLKYLIDLAAGQDPTEYTKDYTQERDVKFQQRLKSLLLEWKQWERRAIERQQQRLREQEIARNMANRVNGRNSPGEGDLAEMLDHGGDERGIIYIRPEDVM